MKTEISAKVIADSLSPAGVRLTTLELEYPRFILPELNTHRAFSRNTASSRAIPTAKLVERVRIDPAIPIEWGSNKPGMVAGEELNINELRLAQYDWCLAANKAADQAESLASLGVHKQIVNRVLEPFMRAKTIVSSTEWENFFTLRISPKAQPEMRRLAECMRDAMEESEPYPVEYGAWHVPYTTESDCTEPDDDELCVGRETLHISAARCARVSYLGHDGKRDIGKDLELFRTLSGNGHLSPLEHVATPAQIGVNCYACGNFTGWAQLRHLKEYW